MGEVIAVACKRIHLSVYLAQKHIYSLNDSNIEIKKIRRTELLLYDDFLLEEHETGYIVNSNDIDAYTAQMEEEKLMLESLISDLKDFRRRLTKEKEIDKIEKALRVVEKHKEEHKTKKHAIDIMGDIMEVPLANIVEEAYMLQSFRYAIQ